MNYKIKSNNSTIEANIQLPASKSISNRALIMQALSYSDEPIQNLAKCDDTDVLYSALNSNSNHFDIGAAGTAMRFLTAFLSKIMGEWFITGSDRMKNRPIGILVDALNEVGANIEYAEKEGYPPLRIHGSALLGGKLSLDGSVSSQFISALLMVAPTMKDGLILNLTGKIISKPYIHLTLSMMKQFGIQSKWVNNEITILPQEYKPISYSVESDWTASSYWYEIAALSKKCKIILPRLYKESMQGDAHVKDIFSQLGVHTKFSSDTVTLTKSENIAKKLIYDFVEQPDLAQTVVVTCCCMNIPFHFSGLQSLKIKETDRIEALKAECKKLGFILEEPANGILEWNGKTTQKEEHPCIETYEDHRMAMAFAPAAMKLGEIEIKNPGVVSKSYPEFWNDLKQTEFEVISE